jgi:hypothetical protein
MKLVSQDHLTGPALGELQVAPAVALQRIEQRQVGLPLPLHGLGLGEAAGRLTPRPGLQQRVGVGGALAHALERLAAPIGVVDRLCAGGDGPSRASGGIIPEPAERYQQLGEIGGVNCSSPPILFCDT